MPDPTPEILAAREVLALRTEGLARIQAARYREGEEDQSYAMLHEMRRAADAKAGSEG